MNIQAPPSRIAEIRETFLRSEPQCERLVELFSILSNKMRLRILCMLMDEEFCVNDITEAVEPGRLTSISQHLRILTLAGLIDRRRESYRALQRALPSTDQLLA